MVLVKHKGFILGCTPPTTTSTTTTTTDTWGTECCTNAYIVHKVLHLAWFVDQSYEAAERNALIIAH